MEAEILKLKKLREDIRLAFAVLQGYIRPGGPLNLTDINIHAEDFVKDVLNALHSWNLINTNASTCNYPCIDLLERNERVGIQVSAERGAKKVNDTIKCICTHSLSLVIRHLKVFSLLPKQGSYKISESCPDVAFNWREDILDFDMLLKQISSVTDFQRLTSINVAVKNAMPSLFAMRQNKLEAIRDHLEQDLRIFDRQVMSAPFRFENPLLMYKAIRDMRVSLQKNGSSRISNELAARNFEAVKKILINMEYRVRERFPYIHDAALSNKTHVQYKKDDFNNAIQLMMQIRKSLRPLIEEVEKELRRIKAEL
jgi:hypothetical protein